MWKFVVFLSLLPLIAAWFGRHWFWSRVRLTEMRHDCGTSIGELRTKLGLKTTRRGMAASDAAALGNAVRECGLALLEKEGHAFARARLKGASLNRVLPALTGMVLVFALVSKRMPVGWAIAAGFGTLGIWTLLRLTGMAVEWRAVARGTEALKSSRVLKRLDDEAAVIRCAKASVWNTVWPF